MAPVTEVTSEHGQIKRHGIVAEVGEVRLPLLAQDAPAKRSFEPCALRLRTIDAAHVQVGYVEDPDAASTHAISLPNDARLRAAHAVRVEDLRRNVDHLGRPS
jgi:hypothetical protein